MAVVGLYIVFFFAQRSVIFQSDPDIRWTPADIGLAYDELRIQVRGETTTGWFVPADAPRGVILFCHGNDGNISTRSEVVSFAQDTGFSLLIYDYGGYGESTGRPSEKRCYADGLAMWDYLVAERNVAPEAVVVWGRSFGGAMAVDLAARVHPRAVILESSFTSMADAAFADYPWIPVKWLLRDRFESIDRVHEIDAPLLVMHSLDDMLYPIHHGQALYNRANDPKTFLELRGDHHDVFHVSRRAYVDGLDSFLDPLFPRGEK